ncbi:hypothetical protein [Gimesia maris]|nr:hypothetical protein [Gimesia maris]
MSRYRGDPPRQPGGSGTTDCEVRRPAGIQRELLPFVPVNFGDFHYGFQ